MIGTGTVHTVGARAMDWLYAHRDGFRLEQDPDPEIGLMDRFQPVGELALICSVLFREGVAGSRQADLARRLVDHAWHDVLDSGHLLVRGQRSEPLSPVPFEVYLPFRELGYIEPEVERAVRLDQRLRGWDAMEITPVRRLGLAAFERRFGAPTRRAGESVADLVAATWLGRTPEPWTVDARTGYDITHTVFHLTEWGRSPGDLPPALAAYLAAWLPAWLDDWLDLQRWDLLGELLVVDACLPEPTLDERAWQGFAAAQQQDGAMPALRTMPEGAPDDVFDVVYHPTLVAAFASTLAVSRAMARLAPDPA
jgi:hypothetical protein